LPCGVLDGPHAIAFADLPGSVAGEVEPDAGRLWHNPFWLTVRNGTIVAITEQYRP
jgi:hypothetical protein